MSKKHFLRLKIALKTQKGTFKNASRCNFYRIKTQLLLHQDAMKVTSGHNNAKNGQKKTSITHVIEVSSKSN
jgi:hypothetical protein